MRKVIPQELSLQDKKEELCFAARRGNIEQVKEFLKEGLNANCIFEGNGYIATPLESAIGGNQEDMIKFLLNEGADPSSEMCGSKAYNTCFEHDGLPSEKRLELLKLFIETKPEIAEEVAEYVTNRIPYLKRNDRFDTTIESEKSQAILNELTQINQSRLEREENLKELAEQTKKTLGLDTVQGRRNNSDEETKCSDEERKSGSLYEEEDPNHKKPESKVRPKQSLSSPVVPMATNSGCIIS